MDIDIDLNKNYTVREEISECINSLASSSKGHDIKDYLSCFSETLTVSGHENESKKTGEILLVII